MDNSDILRKLAVSLDIETLTNFGRESRWRGAVTSLLSKPTFWKEKVVYLSGLASLPDYEHADWNRIYLILADSISMLENRPHWSESEGILEEAYSSALDDLATLQVFLQIAPASHIKYNEDIKRELYTFTIKSLEVLLWLLENRYIDLAIVTSPEFADAVLANDAVDIVEYLHDNVLTTEQERIRLLLHAIQKGAVLSFKRLSDLIDSSLVNELRALRASTQSDNPSMIREVYNKYRERIDVGTVRSAIVDLIGRRYDLLNYRDMMQELLSILKLVDPSEDLDAMFLEARQRNDSDTVELLLSDNEKLQAEVDHEMLLNAIKYSRYVLVPILIKYTVPSAKNNEALKLAADLQAEVAVDALLDDVRVDGTPVAVELVRSGLYGTRDLALLLSHPKIHLEALSIPELSKLVSANNKSNIFAAVSILAPLDILVDTRADIIKDKSPYSMLLVAMLINPSLSSIDWMVAQGKQDYQVAADRVLSGKLCSNAIEALMIAKLYKQSRISEIIAELRVSRASDSEITKAVRLIIASMTRQELERRR
ncbi:Hypothetical protein POVR2_LOCUS118 [uncultured virus]|nr:Hypothetical protein POVR2_LOCUS118 [uncultured virus]